MQTWASDEAAKRPTRARLALSLLHAFLAWCTEHHDFAALAPSKNPARSRRARELLPLPKPKQDALLSEQLPAWFAAVRAIGNLVKMGPDKLQVTGSEQLWVADITYLPTADKCVYLSLVTDAHSRKIVGWHVHASLQTEEVAQALKMALRGRATQQVLVHHSDRGIQYCAHIYQELHRQHGVKCSMTDGYDCYQNALAERVNGILKGEFLLERPKDLAQARQMVKQSIRIYNEERPHLSLKMQTPGAVHRASIADCLRSAA